MRTILCFPYNSNKDKTCMIMFAFLYLVSWTLSKYLKGNYFDTPFLGMGATYGYWGLWSTSALTISNLCSLASLGVQPQNFHCKLWSSVFTVPFYLFFFWGSTDCCADIPPHQGPLVYIAGFKHRASPFIKHALELKDCQNLSSLSSQNSYTLKS